MAEPSQPSQPSQPRRRTNQMERTRSAIVDAARELADSGAEITMPAVAQRARVSEATAYRYFPDLTSLLRAAITTDGQLATLRAATRSDDPVERIGQAAEVLGRAVLAREGAVRAIVASTIAKPATARQRPARRFGLIEYALAPWIEQNGLAGHPEVEQLTRALAVMIGAESVFSLIDLCGLEPEEAIATLVAGVRRLTAATVQEISAPA